MNHTLPPGDCGDRGADPRWASGLARVVPGIGGLVGRTATAGRHKTLACPNSALSAPPDRKRSMAIPDRCGRKVGRAWRLESLWLAV